MKNGILNKSLLAMVTLSFALSSVGARADQEVIISGGTIQLVGTISTTMAGKDDPLSTIGFILIVAGGVLNSREASQGSIRVGSREVHGAMVQAAQVASAHPELTQGEAISFAVAEFEAKDATLGYEQKAKLFANTMLQVNKRADETRAQRISNAKGAPTARELAKEALGENATEKNITSMSNFIAISDLS